MRLYMAYEMTDSARTQDAISRAIRIAKRIAMGDDLRVREKIKNFQPVADYQGIQSLCIAEDAWELIAEAGIDPKMVFAHPDILMSIPDASLHYRGLALLSRKRVQEIAGDVKTWELAPETARVGQAKALKVSCLYNAVISSIIADSTSWTLEDGYRNILATMGITEDGTIRNIIGQEAESAIKERLLEWVQSNDLLTEEQDENSPQKWHLANGVIMEYGSEPDIAFNRDKKLSVLIEIKGGKDPAGALERLGAVKKTFDEAPTDCKNFLILGVVTPTMRTRLDEMRMEADFNIDQLLESNAAWTELMNEIFHHALRIAPEAADSES